MYKYLPFTLNFYPINLYPLNSPMSLAASFVRLLWLYMGSIYSNTVKVRVHIFPYFLSNSLYKKQWSCLCSGVLLGRLQV